MEKSKSPLFITIAGPNGAGKSTISQSLLFDLKMSAFDWDKQFYESWAMYSYDPLVMDGIRESTNELFENQLSKAIKTNSSLAYETNFHSNQNFDLLNKFKKEGYRTSLYFLFVSSVDICKERVRYRFEVEAGHHVNETTIEERYVLGLQNLDKSINFYNDIYIFDTGKFKDMKYMMHIKNGKISILDNLFPKYLESFIPNISKLQTQFTPTNKDE